MSIWKKHLLFWVTIYLFWTYMKSGGGHSYWFVRFLLINLVNVGLYMIAFYSLKHLQIPKFYDRGRLLLFGLSLLFSSVVIYTIWRSMGVLWIDQLRKIDLPFMSMVDYVTQTVQFYSPALLLLVWELYDNRQKEKTRIAQLEKEKLANELKYLKAQLNPHFLFNTLNNLYSYVVNNSPKAPDMILQLSGILDYVLYKSQKQSVRLEEEVQTIDNFLALEKIRYGERLKVVFSKIGPMSSPVSPLILLSIVENAFKHGASGDIESPEIRIKVHDLEGEIRFNVWNTKTIHQGEINDAYKKGIGLSNIKRQLDLLYPSNHELHISDQEKSFEVELTLKPWYNG